MKEYMSPMEAAERWGVSARWVTGLCVQSRIPGVQRIGNAWIIPVDAKKPSDARIKNGKYIKCKTGG